MGEMPMGGHHGGPPPHVVAHLIALMVECPRRKATWQCTVHTPLTNLVTWACLQVWWRFEAVP